MDDGWSKTRHRSFWRETELLLQLVRDALWPKLPIKDCLANWSDLQCGLAERSRKRIPQIKTLLC